MNSGLRTRRRYTVGDAHEDWVAHGLDGVSARTVTLYRGTIVKALEEEPGGVRLTELTAGDVQGALAAMVPRLSTRTLQIAHNVLVRAIRQAERDDLSLRHAFRRRPVGIGLNRRAASQAGQGDLALPCAWIWANGCEVIPVDLVCDIGASLSYKGHRL